MAEQINVLYIDCHDLGDWLGCYGREYVHSPNLDRLAAQGARFDQYFSTAPICMPSRVSMYSGRYPHEAGCLGQMPYDEDTPMSFRAQLRPSSIYHFTTISARTWICSSMGQWSIYSCLTCGIRHCICRLKRRRCVTSLREKRFLASAAQNLLEKINTEWIKV